MSEGSISFDGMERWPYEWLVEQGQLYMFVHQLYGMLQSNVTGTGQGTFVLLVKLFSPGANLGELANSATDPRDLADTAFVLKHALEETWQMEQAQQQAGAAIAEVMRCYSSDPGAPAWEVLEDYETTSAYATVFSAGDYVVTLALAGVSSRWMPMAAQCVHGFFYSALTAA